MRRLIQPLVLLLLILVVGGLGVTALNGVRHAAAKMACTNNLKQFAIALHNYLDFNNHFPAGTVPNAGLPPERRLSGLIEICPALMECTPRIPFDRTKAWDAGENCPPYWFVTEKKNDDATPGHKELVGGQLKWFLCPANPARNPPDLPCPTHYVGVAGVGDEAAGLPLPDPRAGVFGYDRKVKITDVKDGRSTTMLMAEVLDGGPWTAGGRATVRGLEANGVPYLGEGGQFASLHRGGNFFAWQPPHVTNVLFVDGSVRGLTASVSPEVFEALATIAGGEEVGALQDW